MQKIETIPYTISINPKVTMAKKKWPTWTTLLKARVNSSKYDQNWSLFVDKREGTLKRPLTDEDSNSKER